jgi:hypothetical protein
VLRAIPNQSFDWAVNLCAHTVKIQVCDNLFYLPGWILDPIVGTKAAVFFTGDSKKNDRTPGTSCEFGKHFGDRKHLGYPKPVVGSAVIYAIVNTHTKSIVVGRVDETFSD